MKTSRQIAFDTLLLTIKQKAYSNLALLRTLAQSQLSAQDKAFATTLFYGVLERKLTLEGILKKYCKKPIDKLDQEVSLAIFIGLYQLLYMDSVPDSAAVNEATALAIYAKKTSAKGFVNAVLRSFLRDDKAIPLPDPKKDEIGYMSMLYSCPAWLYSMWSEQYGREQTEDILKNSLTKPRICLRVNTLKITAEKLIEELEKSGIAAQKHSFIENCLLVSGTGEIDRLTQFKKGYFHVQDVSSQLCVEAIDLKPSMRFIDVCSAPGSKSFTAAQYMENDGEIEAFDLHEHKIKLIDEGVKRLGITIIKACLQNGSQFNENIKKADRVLCDVPCSGLGIIRRKPEIKYKDKAEIDNLPTVQLSILANASSYVKDGGRLIYSTCTLNKNENQEVVLKFLGQNNSFKLLQSNEKFGIIKNKGDLTTTIFPDENECDGFFFAVLLKDGGEA